MMMKIDVVLASDNKKKQIQQTKREKKQFCSVLAYGRHVSVRAVAGTVFLPIKSFLFASTSSPPTVALSKLQPRPIIHGVWRLGVWNEDAVVGRVSAVERQLVRPRFFSGRGRFLQLCRCRFFSGRQRLFQLCCRRFSLREGEVYTAPSSPYCLRRVEAIKALCCPLGTRSKFGCQW